MDMVDVVKCAVGGETGGVGGGTMGLYGERSLWVSVEGVLVDVVD